MCPSAEGVVHVIKWELRRGWWQHVPIRLFAKLSQMVSFRFWFSRSRWSLTAARTHGVSALLLCGWTSPALSGLCVRLAGSPSGTAACACLRIRSWSASSAPFPLTYASTTREPPYPISPVEHCAPTHCPPSFLCAAPEWRGWWKSTSCVCTRSCVQSASPQCSSERSHGGWTLRGYFRQFTQQEWFCPNLCPRAGVIHNAHVRAGAGNPVLQGPWTSQVVVVEKTRPDHGPHRTGLPVSALEDKSWHRCFTLFSFLQVLAPFSEPQEACGSEVLPPEQKHDPAKDHEALQITRCKKSKLIFSSLLNNLIF